MPEMMTNGSTWDDQMKILMRAEKAEAAVEALTKALEELIGCANAVVGANPNDDDAAEAFDMFADARREARAALSLSRSDS